MIEPRTRAPTPWSWRRNRLFIWIGVFVALLGGTFGFLFVAVFIKGLGVTGTARVSYCTGIAGLLMMREPAAVTADGQPLSVPS